MIPKISIYCFLLYWLSVGNLYGQTDNLHQSEVREIVENDETHLLLTDLRNSRLTRKYKVVIQNKEAENRRIIRLPYNKFERVKYLKVRVSDTSGKTWKQYNLKDCQDISVGFGSVAEDSRLKYLEIIHNQYPYIIEAEYRIDFKDSRFFPSWYPVSSDQEIVKQASLKVTDEQHTGFRHREYQVSPPVITQGEKGTEYFWQIGRTGPIKNEDLCYQPELLLPIVFLGACDFEVDGYAGNLESWKNYGQWMALLNKDKNDLTSGDVATVKELCSSLTDPLEKIKAVYRYVQQNTRYVSIQLGIGGWQPFNAHFVHEKKYGDCKALSFYTQSLLEAVGIPAYYTVIRAGADVPDIIPDFPLAHFNHVIVTVPLQEDTLWLECTSHIKPAGYLGSFTSGRYCLLVDSSGGHLIRTKTYTEQENTENTYVTLDFQKEKNNLPFSMEKTLTGLQIEKDNFFSLQDKEEREKEKWIQDHAYNGTLEMQTYHIFPLTGDIVPSTGYQVQGNLKRFCQQTGNNYFFCPFRFTTLPDYDLGPANRQTPVTIRYPFTQTDTIEILLPPNGRPESLFPPKDLQTLFGQYSTAIRHIDDGKILFIRRFCLKPGQYPASAYLEFREFIQQVKLADRQQVVFNFNGS